MVKKLRRIIFFAFAFIFINKIAFSQSLKTLVKQGTEAMNDKNYFSAAQIYNQIILKDSANLQYLYTYATASRLNFDNDIALRFYEKIYKIDNGKAFPETPFWIGEILKSKSRYKEAKKYFNKYTNKNRKSKDAEVKRLADKSQLESESCDLSLIMMKNPVPVTIEHLDTNVNSKVSEYAPIEVDSILYFSSLRNKIDKDKKNDISFNKIFIAKKDSANSKHRWKLAFEMDSIINRQGVHTANTAFNKDFTEVVFSRCTQKNAAAFSCKLYTSKYINEKWATPVLLPAPVNTDGSSSTHPNWSELNNETYLFFSSDRSGGQGGMDIWYCKKTSDETYSNPVNAGKLINSYEDEKTPYLENITKTLYFSSNHHKGMGGYDIFKSQFKDEKFSAPENAGYPINSALNDFYYSVNSRKDKVYLSSNRLGSYFEEKQSCCNDIYAFAITRLVKLDTIVPVDTVKQIMNQLKVLVPLTLYFHNDEPDKKTLAVTTPLNYKKTCLDYLAMIPLYLKEFPKGLKGDTLNIATNKVENFFEDSVQSGLNDLEKFALLLEDVLRRGETVKITMKGFCSPLASTDYNVNLAKRRISSLQNYFREYKNGIFMPYIQSGKVIFFEENIGELPKSTSSDDYYDTRNSIYNPKAASERKIQIIAVSEVR